MKTRSFTQAAIFVYFTGAHVSGIWVLGKWLTNQTKVSFVGGIVIELFVQQMAIALYKIASPSVSQSVPK